MAQQHHLRPWQIYTHELVPLIKNQEYLLQKDTKKTSIKQTFLTQKKTSSNLSVINGLQYITPVIVSAIEYLTRREDLRFLTLVSWFHLFSSYDSLLKQFCSWCSHCGEWLGKRHPPLNLADYFFSHSSLKVYQQNIAYLQDLIRITPSLSKPPRIKDVCIYLH